MITKSRSQKNRNQKNSSITNKNKSVKLGSETNIIDLTNNDKDEE